MEGINSAYQNGEVDLTKMLEKIKSAKSTKLNMKHLASFQKQKKKKLYIHDTNSKKKFKLRKSEV